MKPWERWNVLPHQPIMRLAENLFTVVGTLKMPVGAIQRRMTVVRLSGRRLLIFSAIALDESEMADLEELGRPTFLVVPSEIHRLDAKIWKDRYPDLVVITPRGARDKVSEVVAVDATDPDQIRWDDASVRLTTLPGTLDGELSLEVDTRTGTTLVVNDLIFNLPAKKGLGPWLLRLLGFQSDRPLIPALVRMKLIKDKHALRAQLQWWADMISIERILVSHGDPIENPRHALLQIAGGLA